jgi:Cysteine dioxygenase type I
MNSDVSIAGDPLAIPHLLPPVPRHPSTVAEFAGLARAIAADRSRWAPLVRYDATTRWYARLETGPGYEVWLLSWVPGQGTGLHDHGGSSGVLTVLRGGLTERTPTSRRKLVSDDPRVAPTGGAPALPPGAGAGARSRVFAPGYAHEIVNDSLEPAVSLHVYFPGLTEMTPLPATGATAARTGGSAVSRG